jgi:quercetin dioxygenase-like cupin family protein
LTQASQERMIDPIARRTQAASLEGEEKVLRVLGSKRKWIAATVGVAVIGTFVTMALGSHTPFNFTTTPLATGDLANKVKLNSDRIKFQTKGPTDVRVARIEIAPGGHSGWHHHPGIVIITVAQGAVTYTRSDCSSKTYGPGQPDGAVFIEAGDEPALASNQGTTPVISYATFIAPDGAGFRVEDHDFQGCP